MYVTSLNMVPAVVNFVSTKGRDTYSGIINDLMCIKCKTVSFLLQTTDKEIDVSDPWRSNKSSSINKQQTTHRSDSPRTAFKKWRKNNSLKQNGCAKDVAGVGADCKKTGADEDMSLLKFLAINALDLSAPASDVLLKNRGTSDWFQLSGHPDSLAPAGPGTVWKKRSACPGDTERLVYEEISLDSSIRDIVPKYYREVEYHGERFIELQDLLHGFQDPYVMDIKMGTRTFLECEVLKTAPRTDLYAKMVAIDASAPTASEHETRTVTKLRYMQFREQQSSSCSHGFRVEAMKCRGQPPVSDMKRVKTDEDVTDTLTMWVGAGGRSDVGGRLVQRLREMRSKIEQSEYFRRHEVIGSSVFMIYDDHKVGVWLIDFAKTNSLSANETVDHRSDWVPGNHEEGLLFGFDELINNIEAISSSNNSTSLALSKTLQSVSVKS